MPLAAAVSLVRLVSPGGVLAAEALCIADEASRAAPGERAEPEQVALIARLVVVDEEAYALRTL
jgi:hypothetical protein